jgi:hypothetical protein
VTGFFVFFKFINMTIKERLKSDDIEIVRMYYEIAKETMQEEEIKTLLNDKFRILSGIIASYYSKPHSKPNLEYILNKISNDSKMIT